MFYMCHSDKKPHTLNTIWEIRSFGLAHFSVQPSGSSSIKVIINVHYAYSADVFVVSNAFSQMEIVVLVSRKSIPASAHSLY